MRRNENDRANDIVIDDGSKVYNIKNRSGAILGRFCFRPSDTNIVQRYEEVVEFFNNLKIPENEEGAIKTIENEVVNKIGYLIDADAKEAFFDILGPFSVLSNGELFVENVVNAIGKTIEKEMSVRTKRMEKRMNKYVAKYHK